jgi:hypothetical protein
MRSTRLRKARRLHPTFDGIRVAEVMKTIIDPPIVELEKAISAKRNDRFTVAFDELTRPQRLPHGSQ